MNSPLKKKYWAFISYSSKDKKWGQWLHKRLERYPIPKELQGTTLFDGAILGKHLRPIFRDRDELSGSADLGPALEKALRESRYLVVLCSKQSAASTWVNKEIEDFKAIAGEKNILALILDGEPNSGGSEECFPPALRYPNEPLAGDLRKDGDGKERGILKIIAGAAQLDFDTLYRRHERAQRKKRIAFGSLGASVIAALTGLTIFAFHQRTEARKNALAETAAKVEAEASERRATNTLVRSYVDRGRQSFVDGSTAESLAFLNEARQLNPEISGIDRIMSDAWTQLSPLKAEIEGDRKKVSQLFFSSDGTTLAAQNAHGGIRLFQLAPAKLTLTSHQFIGFMPDPLVFSSTPFLTAYFEQTDPKNPNYLTREIRRIDWHANSNSGRIPWPVDLPKPNLIVASPSGNLVATYTEIYGELSNNNLQLWKIDGSKVLKTQFNLNESPKNFHWFFSADEQTLAQLHYSGDTFEITFREASTGEVLLTSALNSRPEAQTTYANRICIGLHNGEIIEFQRGQEITRRSPAAGSITQLGTLQYSSDGKQLLAGGTFGNVVLYHTEDFSIAHQIDRQQLDGVVQHVALSKGGRFISVAHKSRVSIFETSSPKLYGQFSWTGSNASFTSFSDDETLLAAGSESGNLRVWELQQQASWLREYQPESESMLVDLKPLDGDQCFLHGLSDHLLDLSSGAMSEFSANEGTVTALSPDQQLIQLGDSYSALRIKNAKTGKHLEAPWNTGAKNVFLKTGSPASGVIIQNDGVVQAYSSIPVFLADSHRSEEIQGSLHSIVTDPVNPVVCASFADGSILVCSITAAGIQDPAIHRLPGSESTPPILHELHDEFLLLSLSGQMAIYNLSELSLLKLPRQGLRSGKFLTIRDQLSVLTIDIFGKLEAWSHQGTLLANAPSPIQTSLGSLTLAQPKVAGSTILVNRSSDTAYTTFGNQLYLWSLPDLSLSWRSPGLTSFGELLTLKELSDAEDMVVLTDHPFGNEQSISKVFTVTPPTLVPETEDVDRYLSDVAGIKIVEGRFIRQ